MESNNLTISIPPEDGGEICDKNCPYCVSVMTGYVKPNYHRVMRNLDKAKTAARAASVSSVMITGKGEPLLNFGGVMQICGHFEDYPLEIQTNGLWLNRNRGAIKELDSAKMDTIAISIDRIGQILGLASLYECIHSFDMIARVCLNLTNLATPMSFWEMFEKVKQAGVDQLLIRNVTIPKKLADTVESRKAVAWIKENVDPLRYKMWNTEFMHRIVEERDLTSILPHGARIYDFDDVSVCCSDYCIQEANNTKNIRSLVLLESGALQPTWDKKSSRVC
jgi:organic radical activating enzyme